MRIEWEENTPKNPIKNPMTWDEAMEYARSAGGGWRLPSKEELEKVYHDKVKGFESDVYWSSSTYAQPTIGAWGVSFSDGDVDYYYKTGNYYVRCVRDVK